ncbi:MAG: hypothetical protein V3V33_13125 [Candidatus Lokiarchaeia archaeon]
MTNQKKNMNPHTPIAVKLFQIEPSDFNLNEEFLRKNVGNHFANNANISENKMSEKICERIYNSQLFKIDFKNNVITFEYYLQKSYELEMFILLFLNGLLTLFNRSM